MANFPCPGVSAIGMLATKHHRSSIGDISGLGFDVIVIARGYSTNEFRFGSGIEELGDGDGESLGEFLLIVGTGQPGGFSTMGQVSQFDEYGGTAGEF